MQEDNGVTAPVISWDDFCNTLESNGLTPIEYQCPRTRKIYIKENGKWREKLPAE